MDRDRISRQESHEQTSGTELVKKVGQLCEDGTLREHDDVDKKDNDVGEGLERDV